MKTFVTVAESEFFAARNTLEAWKKEATANNRATALEYDRLLTLLTCSKPLETVAQRIAALLVARQNCLKSGNVEWFEKHGERIDSLIKNHFPSGSGFDSGTAFDEDESKPDRLVFTTAFHHMDEGGSYDGWTHHSVIVRPCLPAPGHDIKVTGRDRNGIKEYIGDVFAEVLRAKCEMGVY